MAEHKIDPIRHVVLLILENHSFDKMLGCMKQLYPHLDGIDPNTPHTNSDPAGQVYAQAPTTERIMFLDPHHEVNHVRIQLEDHNGGFVRDFAQSFPDSTSAARQLIMGYYPFGFLPALHTLARNFTICDHWFSSLPGPTWPNRFFALTGTSNGRVNMPDDGTHKIDLAGYFQQTQVTLFDRLNDRGIHWKVYFHDVPQTTVLEHQRQPHNMARYFYIDKFFDDARGHEAEFPQFCFIEPDYLGFEQNDDHPPHDIMRGEKLIADVYNAIRANDPLWKSTLLIVFFDEHGGFYDHVVPPPAMPPDDHHEEYTFDQLGVRVPALLVSPWADARVVDTVFDHTSVLRYLIDKWGLGPLGRRAAQAASIGGALTRETPREDAIERIELAPGDLRSPDPHAEEEAFGLVTTHQQALGRLCSYLKHEIDEKIPRGAALSARFLEMIKSLAERFLGRAYEEPAGLPVSIAEPDKLAGRKDVTARDTVARFLMRKKKYAAIGLRRRLADSTLSPAQRDHAIHTLSLISGRDFHRQSPETQAQMAQAWLDQQLGGH